MQSVEVDFQVFKALTNLRQSETHTYNEVIRDLLGLEKTLGRQMAEKFGGIPKVLGPSAETGFYSRGLLLPNGTELRARYKGQIFSARIENGEWLDQSGKAQLSPSGAAHSVTGTNVNGWRFWEAKRPSDSIWRKLDAIPQSTR